MLVVTFKWKMIVYLYEVFLQVLYRWLHKACLKCDDSLIKLRKKKKNQTNSTVGKHVLTQICLYI